MRLTDYSSVGNSFQVKNGLKQGRDTLHSQRDLAKVFANIVGGIAEVFAFIFLVQRPKVYRSRVYVHIPPICRMKWVMASILNCKITQMKIYQKETRSNHRDNRLMPYEIQTQSVHQQTTNKIKESKKFSGNFQRICSTKLSKYRLSLRSTKTKSKTKSLKCQS